MVEVEAHLAGAPPAIKVFKREKKPPHPVKNLRYICIFMTNSELLLEFYLCKAS